MYEKVTLEIFQSLQARNVIWHSCFPANFTKFLRTPLLQNSSDRF